MVTNFLKTKKGRAKIVVVGETSSVSGSSDPSFWFSDAKWKLLKRLMFSAGITEADLDWISIMGVPQAEFKKHYNVNKARKSPVKASEDFEAGALQAVNYLLEAKPNVIVPVGDGALYAITRQWGINSYRGSVLEGDFQLHGMKIIPLLDPQSAVFAVNKDDNGGLTGNSLKLATYFDVMKIKAEKESPLITRRERKLGLYADHDELDLSKKRVGYDIETFHNEIICTGFATSEDEAYCSPLVRYGDDCHVTTKDEVEFWKDHAKVLGDPNLTKVVHNAAFEHLVLWRNYGIELVNYECSMLAHFTLWRDLPKSLAFCTSLHTDIPFYKDEGDLKIKLAAIFGDDEDYWDYNSRDCITCLEVWDKIEAELLRLDLWPTYAAARDMVPIVTYLHEKGMRVDLEGLEAEASRINREIGDTTKALEAETWPGFNVASPKDMTEYFFSSSIDAPPIKARKAKSPGFADDTLRTYASLPPERLKGKDKAARAEKIQKTSRLCRSLRKLRKNEESFMNMKFDDDGRFRSCFNPMVKTQRLSSRKSLNNTGGNMQNLPKSFRKFILADKGYLMLAPDLSQAEARIVAYGGPVPEAMKEFESGLDVHKLCASMMFDKPYEEISDVPGEGAAALIGSGDKSERHWGKTYRHAFNYGLGPKNFAIQQDVAFADGLRAHRKYHTVYPNVVAKFHRRMFEQLKVDRTITNLLGFKRIFRGMEIDMNLAAVAANHYAQSTVGAIINERGLKFLWDEPDMYDVEILNQIHDQILFQIPLDAGPDYILHVMNRLSASLEQPLDAPGGSFSIPTDMQIGGNFGELKDFPFRGENALERLEEFLDDYKKAPAQAGVRGLAI